MSTKILPDDKLYQTRPKLNQAIDNAEEALGRASRAEVNSNTAKTTVNSVQTQLNQIVVEGDSSVEAAQARVDKSGNTSSTLKERLDKQQYFVSIKDFGALGDGVTDDTVAIKNAVATGKSVFFPEPDNFYSITDTIGPKFPGQILFTNGRKRGMIQNVTNDKQLVTFGDTAVNNGATPQAGIRGLTFGGNAATVGGIRLNAKSSGNVDWTDADKDTILEDVVVDNVGNGWALEVYSWCNDIKNFTAYTGNKRGALFAKEHNQNNISGIYLTGCAEQSLQIGDDGSALRGRGNTFNGIVVQQSGGLEGCVIIGDVDNLVLNGIYLEANNSKGSPRAVFVKNSARGVVINGVNSLGGGSVVIRNEGIGTLVNGVTSSNVAGVVVENAGAGQIIAAGIEWVAGTTTTTPKFSDLSTTKTGFYLDSAEGFSKGMITSFSPSFEFIDKSAGAYNWQYFMDQDAAHFKYDKEKDGTYETTAWRFNGAVPEMVVDGAFRPETDNNRANGGPTRRWSEVFSGTGVINTSDRREKQQITSIPDEVLDAWAEVNYTQFKFNDSVEEKGEAARFHVGLIAQEIEEVFLKHGLDAFEYGILCYDEWDDIYESRTKTVEETGEETGEEIPTTEMVLVTPAGSRYGIRANECLMLEAALLRRRIERLEGVQ